MPLRHRRAAASRTLASALAAACVALPVAARADELAEVQRLQSRGEMAAALSRAEKALAEQPRDARLRFAKGVLLADLQRDDEALALFGQLSEDYPELPDPLNNIAVILARRGQLDEARNALESALRAAPTHRMARENLADVYVRLAMRLWQGLRDNATASGALSQKLRLADELLRQPGN